ncbi:hypothetical protein EMCRGX_G021747 [Ephydatia muelleri]|eukprot:Em0009g436a
MERAAFVLFAANVAFAILSVIGQVGQNVSLPLWLAAAQQNTSGNASGDENADSMGPYFVLSFSSLAFVVVFGLATLISFALFPRRVTREELAFPQWQLFLVGLFDSLNGLFVVYASPPVRTAPFLQAILGNFLIPLTIVFRLLIIRKRPTLLKLCCAGAVLIGLLASLIPIMSGDNSDPQDKQAWLQQPIAARVLWPLCFMFGFVPAALMNVFQEKGLKDSRKVNLLYYLFWINLHQLWVTALLFWFDIVPYFGTSNGIQQFGRSYWFSVKCFFGGAGCNSSAGVRGTVFIAMYVLSYVAQGLLIRYAEGATLLAIVQAVVSPLGALFWSLFSCVDGCDTIEWGPNATSLTYYSIGGLILIVPAIFLYNMPQSDVLKCFICRCARRYNASYPAIQAEETEPFLKGVKYDKP